MCSVVESCLVHSLVGGLFWGGGLLSLFRIAVGIDAPPRADLCPRPRVLCGLSVGSRAPTALMSVEWRGLVPPLAPRCATCFISYECR